jgi:hypothetical protein
LKRSGVAWRQSAADPKIRPFIFHLPAQRNAALSDRPLSKNADVDTIRTADRHDLFLMARLTPGTLSSSKDESCAFNDGAAGSFSICIGNVREAVRQEHSCTGDDVQIFSQTLDLAVAGDKQTGVVLYVDSIGSLDLPFGVVRRVPMRLSCREWQYCLWRRREFAPRPTRAPSVSPAGPRSAVQVRSSGDRETRMSDSRRRGPRLDQVTDRGPSSIPGTQRERAALVRSGLGRRRRRSRQPQ